MRGRKGSKKIEKTISIQMTHKQRISHTKSQNKTQTTSHKKEVSRDLEKNWLGQAVNLHSNKLGF